VEQGGQLQTHDDVPKDIREQIYAEDQQRLERHQKVTNIPSSNLLPINITNVLPASVSTSPMADQPPPITSITVPGLRDTALKEYCDWQQSQVGDLE
jgi:hypothetical protein